MAMIINPYIFMAEASPYPPALGQLWASEGGYYIGDVTVADGGANDGSYWIVMAPLSANARLQWKNANTATAGTASFTDGLGNTASIESAGLSSHPAAQYCRSYAGGGKNDWYLPAPNELALAWTNRALLSEDAAMREQFYWTSATAAAATARYRLFTDGSTGNINKSGAADLRPFRRIAQIP